jgi:hypothetical protein
MAVTFLTAASAQKPVIDPSPVPENTKRQGIASAPAGFFSFGVA